MSFFLDDALEDLKSQKKKIVSKTSRKASCYEFDCNI